MIIKYFTIFFILISNGVIEFLPISSTAHNIILFKFLKINYIDLNLLLVLSQLGITLTVCLYFIKDILTIARKFFSDRSIRFFCFKMQITALPTVIFGLLFHKIIKNIFYKNELLIFLFLFLGGVFMLFVKEGDTKEQEKTIYDIDLKTSFKIGLFQALSLIPGVSRSASTICAAMLFKINKSLSIRYSFFISIYISLMACVFDLYKNFHSINSGNLQTIAIAFCVSFLFSYCIIKKMFKFLVKTPIRYFGYYRIIVAVLLTILFFI